MKRTERLLEKANNIVVKDFKSLKEAKHYSHELSEELKKEQERLMEEKRKLDDKIWELNRAERKVYEYYLRVN